jgi:APA family basic amino acid/polyamine antiporter
VVCAGVLVLRYTRPNEHRPFRVPWAPFTCVLGTVYCLALTLTLSLENWIRLVIWTVIGLSIYALYGFKHSRLRQ